MPTSSHRLTIWAVLTLLAAPLLWGFCWLDTTFAGETWSYRDGFLPYTQADTVSFGLGGLHYFYHGRLLTGPHIGYPLMLVALAVNTLLLWLMRGWDAVRARRMFLT